MSVSTSKEELLIEPGQGVRHYWRDLWDYRELFYFLSWRDVAVRYKQTVLGVAWSILRPVLTMIVFTVIFGQLANLPSDGVPYPILVYSAMLPWQFFASSLTESSNSLVANAQMISKIYFPRLALPVSAIVVSFIDFGISFVVLIVLMLAYRYPPTWRMVTLPLFIVLAFGAALGAGLWLASLNVRYRDFRYIVPFAVQLGLYVSPVGFTSSVVPEEWRLLYSLNPMVGVIDGFRWAILRGEGALYWPGIVLSVILVTSILLGGLSYFRRTERTFADVI
jgi:lipopolysaccharide transport system permease protein